MVPGGISTGIDLPSSPGVAAVQESSQNSGRTHAGAESGSGVGQEEVFTLFRANLERLTGLLARAVAALPDPAGCSCSSWVDGIDLTYDVP